MDESEIIYATVTTKGQVVIPSRIRRELGIRAGTRVAFQRNDGHVVLQPMNGDAIEKWRGMFQDRGETLRHYMREHRKAKW
jgi:AbrB family looped-hinge helix DNA binding protein